MRIVKRVTLCCMIVLFGSLFACAPRDSGFGSVQVLLEERAGLEARWRYLDGSPDERVAEMLNQPVGPEEAVRIALLNNYDLQASFEELVASSAIENPIVIAPIKPGIVSCWITSWPSPML